MAWTGNWNDTKTAFTGSYEFPDGTVFTGFARRIANHVIVHTTPDDFTKTVEMPVEPHFEFTGSWEKDGAASAMMMPPDPPEPK